VQLGICAFAFALSVGLTLGVLSGVKQNGPLDYLGVFVATAGAAVPNFVLSVFLVLFFGLKLGWFDVIGWELGNPRQMVLPIVALGMYPAAFIARITRASMLEVLRQDYIRTARAKGLREWVIISRHALKNSMIPVITLFGLQVGVLFGGTVVLEGIFSLPGLGLLTFQSVLIKDYTQVQGLVLFFAAILVTINLLVDLSYAWFDPRIRYG
jgi:oligopeptide transport system permease protein